MMKKTFFFLLFSLIFIFCSFAGNEQKIYSTSSADKQIIDLLSISSGIAMPSSSGPWSQAELSLMLEQINVNKLSNSEKSIYQALINKFNKEEKFASI